MSVFDTRSSTIWLIPIRVQSFDEILSRLPLSCCSCWVNLNLRERSRWSIALLLSFVRYLRSSFKRLLNSWSTSIREREKERSQMVCKGKQAALLTFVFFVQGSMRILERFIWITDDITSTQRTFQMLAEIRLSLQWQRSVRERSKEFEFSYQHSRVQEDSRCITETFIRKIKQCWVTFLFALFEQLIDLLGRQRHSYVWIASDGVDRFTCSRSFNTGWTKRLYSRVEPVNELIHKTMRILIQ